MTHFKQIMRFMWLTEEQLNELYSVTSNFALIHSISSPYEPLTLVKLDDEGWAEMQEYHAGHKDGIEEMPW